MRVRGRTLEVKTASPRSPPTGRENPPENAAIRRLGARGPQAPASSDTMLRVTLVSTGTPGPIVVESVVFFT